MSTSAFPRVAPTRDRVAKLTPCPPHLQDAEKMLFRQIVSEFQVDDAGSIELLTTAMEAHARMRGCREQIDVEGLTVRDRFSVSQPHPLLKTEVSARGQYLGALRALNLEPPKPGRAWTVR